MRLTRARCALVVLVIGASACGSSKSHSASTATVTTASSTTSTVPVAAAGVKVTTDVGVAAPAGATRVTMLRPTITPSAVRFAGGAPIVIYLVNANTDHETPPCPQDFHACYNHALRIKGPTGFIGTSAVLLPGQAGVLRIEGLTAGSYTMFCPIGNHQDLGETGTLTVT
jgi:uncharacterized cupredoxin-like copper-binding protein